MQTEKQLLKANQSMLGLIDRELARLRERSGPLAAVTEDPDSFLPYMLSFNDTGDDGILVSGTGTVFRTFSGSAQIDSDAAFLATGWQAFYTVGATLPGALDQSLYSTFALLTLPADVRLVDTTANRRLVSGNVSPDTLWGTRMAVHSAFAPVVPIVSPFLLPRNTSMRLDLTLNASTYRFYFILHGLKVFGD